MTDEVVPHFHNEPGVPLIEIGAKKFMCIGASPPQDHPHVFCDMGEDVEYARPYCSTLYRPHTPALGPNQARPAECELHERPSSDFMRWQCKAALFKGATEQQFGTNPASFAELSGSKKEHTHHYLRWTFFGAVAVMIVGLIGVGLSFLH